MKKKHETSRLAQIVVRVIMLNDRCKHEELMAAALTSGEELLAGMGADPELLAEILTEDPGGDLTEHDPVLSDLLDRSIGAAAGRIVSELAGSGIEISGPKDGVGWMSAVESGRLLGVDGFYILFDAEAKIKMPAGDAFGCVSAAMEKILGSKAGAVSLLRMGGEEIDPDFDRAQAALVEACELHQKPAAAGAVKSRAGMSL